MTVNKLIIQLDEDKDWCSFCIFPPSYLLFYKMSPKDDLHQRHQECFFNQNADFQTPSQLGCVSLWGRNQSISIFKLAAQVILMHTHTNLNALPITLPH